MVTLNHPGEHVPGVGEKAPVTARAFVSTLRKARHSWQSEHEDHRNKEEYAQDGPIIHNSRLGNSLLSGGL